MALESVTLHRRATDAGEPTNRDILDRLDTIADRLARADTVLAVHEIRIEGLLRLAEDIRPLQRFQTQVETIGANVKWILGGSLITLLASIAALIASFSHIIQTGP